MDKHSNIVDIQPSESDDLSVRYRHALKLAQAGKTEGLSLLCEAVNTLAWEHVNLYDVIAVLGDIGDEQCADVLIDFLPKWTGHARGDALFALLKIGTKNAVDAVFEELRGPSHWFGRGTAQLIADYQEKYIDRLITASQDPDPIVRKRAIYALGIISQTVDEKSLINILISALQDVDSGVRAEAAKGLSKHRTQAAQSALAAVLADPDVEVIQWAAEGLYYTEEYQNEGLNILINSLKDEDSLVCRQAAWALKRIGDIRAVPALIDVLQTDERRGPKCYAIEALGSLKDEQSLQPLYTALSDPDEMVRGEAIKALVNLLGSTMLPQLVDFLFDIDTSVQGTVIRVWEQHGYHPNHPSH